MITFDKLKILLPLSCVEVNTDSQEWKQSGKNGTDPETKEKSFVVTSLQVGTLKEKKTRYRPHVLTQSVRPGLNYIAIDYIQQECTVVMTGGIIPDTALLSRETILQALQSVNESGLIRLNIEAALREAHLLSADVTADHVMLHPIKDYTRCISTYYAGSDYKQFQDYAPNLQLQHKNKSKELKRSLTLYDKYKEAPNEGYQRNTLRTELRLTSFEMMRRYLKLQSGRVVLTEALNSAANPLQTVFMEIQKDILSPTMPTRTDIPASLTTREAIFYHEELTRKEKRYFADLKFNNFDLQRLRKQLKGDKNAAREINDYSKILARWQSFNSDSSHDAELLRELVGKIKTPTIHNIVANTLNEYAESVAA